MVDEPRGVHSKIDRAKSQVDDLAASIQAVIGPGCQRYVFDRHAEAGWHALRVFGVPDIQAGRELLIGEILFNLRSALDHLAWRIVELDGKRTSSARSALT